MLKAINTVILSRVIFPRIADDAGKITESKDLFDSPEILRLRSSSIRSEELRSG
jgi:hypothetical protein